MGKGLAKVYLIILAIIWILFLLNKYVRVYQPLTEKEIPIVEKVIEDTNLKDSVSSFVSPEPCSVVYTYAIGGIGDLWLDNGFDHTYLY